MILEKKIWFITKELTAEDAHYMSNIAENINNMLISNLGTTRCYEKRNNHFIYNPIMGTYLDWESKHKSFFPIQIILQTPSHTS